MTKINRILQEWVSGTVVSSDWLKQRGVGKHLAETSGHVWFEKLTSGHAWFEKLNVSEIDLGKGKRVVVPGGAFNKKYRITVPEKQPEF